jgi:anaerobic magnesium-protoporphyrin IX monomethyl ester cyclase
MRWLLVNPAWDFAGSVYFGCREPHLPLEFGYSAALLRAAGHEATILDGHLEGQSERSITDRISNANPDVVVVTTAPSYLFWRCAPPELRVPLDVARGLRGLDSLLVVVGPHGSSTPESTLRKMSEAYGSRNVVVVLGECEEVLASLAKVLEGGSLSDACRTVPSVCFWEGDTPKVNGGPHASRMDALPALRWDDATIQRHVHHHHRFEAPYSGPGAEIEVSRGCPYRCTFCAKENFRNKYRKRPLSVVLEELDAVLSQGITYVYLIDEIFLPDRELLEAFAQRRRERETPFHFGIQTRIDLWDAPMLELLGEAGCVSTECGIESISDAGRKALDKRCKLSTDELAERLILAKRFVPFVQANLLDGGFDDPAAIAEWRESLRAQGVWANDPVPMLAYPGSPLYMKLWGAPDDRAWERAHAHYLAVSRRFAEFQCADPLPLPELEAERADDPVPA